MYGLWTNDCHWVDDQIGGVVVSHRRQSISKAAVCVALFLGLMVMRIKAHPVAQVFTSELGRMPAIPQPYRMRNWSRVSRQFYKVVFDSRASGPFLPLIHMIQATHIEAHAFVMPSYVDQKPDVRSSAQALSDMGAVWGATLVGRNMSAGTINYVRLLERFFDPSVGHGLFGNNFRSANPQATAWYTIFPDITAAAISARYPAERKLAKMCRATALSWADAIPHFKKPDGRYDFNYTGFNFSTMRPVYNGRWREPDMAAGIAWVEYMAWQRWHDPVFLHAAKACMQYLSNLPRSNNPSYEVLTPFGVIAAIRMNVELRKHYPVEKFLYWCFSRYHARPTWGVENAQWDGQDVDGLVGAVNHPPQRPWGVGGYAFFMETATQLWALAPVARYDQRYATALGKWILNTANASRLFYGKFHPAARQSDPGWALGESLIAYEGLKYRRDYPAQPLIATGDRKSFLDPGRSGRNYHAGATNYCLYGAVYVGVLGSLVQKTNVRGILQINLGSTDTSAPVGFPTFLFYNPYKRMRTVTIKIGSKKVNLYNTMSGDFIAHNVSGTAPVSVPPNSAVILVYTAADGVVSYHGHETLVNNCVIDYRHGQRTSDE